MQQLTWACSTPQHGSFVCPFFFSSESPFVSAVCDLHVAFLDWKQPSPRLEPRRRRRRRPRKARHQSGFSFFSFFFPNFVVSKVLRFFSFFFFWGQFTPKKPRLSKRILNFSGLIVQGWGKFATQNKNTKPCSKCFLQGFLFVVKMVIILT